MATVVALTEEELEIYEKTPVGAGLDLEVE
jgi:hypothetical protein